MKKVFRLVCIFVCVIGLTGCGNDTHEVGIIIPARTTKSFIYSNEELSPTSNHITISASDGLGDTEVVLKPIGIKEEIEYKPMYLTHGMHVTMNVEKGERYKIGLLMENETDSDITVYIKVKGIKIRIE